MDFHFCKPDFKITGELIQQKPMLLKLLLNPD